MNEVLGIIIAAVICWLHFVLLDTWMGLAEKPGVRGAEVLGRDIQKRGGDLAGGFFQGNLACSLDASAGTLLAAVGCYAIGIPEGGFIAAVLVYFGNRICADPGHAGTVGTLTMTVIIAVASFVGLTPEMFIVGMIIAIFTIQGIYHPASSKLLGKLAKKMGRYTKIE